MSERSFAASVASARATLGNFLNNAIDVTQEARKYRGKNKGNRYNAELLITTSVCEVGALSTINIPLVVDNS